jgi:ABC-type multidrug transport system ATPase subunit
MRTIATLQNPDSGSIFFDEINVLKDPMSLRKVLGYLPQEFGVYPKMNAEELLDYFATLKGIASKKERTIVIEKVLEITNLSDAGKKHVSSYSGGMKQRFGIAQLLLNDPKLIIVDEPTAGLDPAERNRFLNVLREIASSNMVIFSTHIVDDIKELCHELAIMNKGKILKQNTPLNAVKEIEGKLYSGNFKQHELLQLELRYNILSSKFNPDDTLSIRIHSEEAPHDDFSPVEPVLEDMYFITLSGDKIREQS